MAKDKKKKEKKHLPPIKQGDKFICPRCRAEVPMRHDCPTCSLEIDWRKI
jgi:predicted RNA-binding Zn-ribbon protein involved in translation (DUF1610 family)